MGGVAILLLLNRFRKNPVMVFGMGILVSGFMEYVTSWGLEHFFHTAWWDYSESFLNLNGRVCLLGLLCFAAGGSVVIHWAAPFLHRHFDRLLPKNQKLLLCGLLLLLFAVDVLIALHAPNMSAGVVITAV